MNLQKAPAFLLDLFRLRTTGQQPTGFGDTVVPTTDVTGMYGALMQVTGSTNGSAGALPRVQFIADIGETARYYGLAGSVIVGAAPGTQMQLTLGVLLPSQGGAFFPIFNTMIITPQAARTYYVGGLFPSPITFPDGACVQLIAAGDAGGADHNTSMFTYLEDPRRG